MTSLHAGGGKTVGWMLGRMSGRGRPDTAAQVRLHPAAGNRYPAHSKLTAIHTGFPQPANHRRSAANGWRRRNLRPLSPAERTTSHRNQDYCY